MLEIFPDSFEALRDLDRLAKKMGGSIRDIADYQAGLMGLDAIKSSPPLSPNMRLSETAGKRAITKDVFKIAAAVNKRTKIWPAGPGLWRTKIASGAVIDIPEKMIDFDGLRLPQFHDSKRNPMTGRTPRKFNPNNAIYVRVENIKNYIKTVYPRIGKFAGTWVPATLHFISKSKIPINFSAPDFVVRNAGGGAYTEAMTRDGNGYLSLISRFRYGYKSKLESLYKKLIKTRQNDLNKQIFKRLRDYTIQFNSGRRVA